MDALDIAFLLQTWRECFHGIQDLKLFEHLLLYKKGVKENLIKYFAIVVCDATRKKITNFLDY